MSAQPSTALERKLSPLNVWALALGCIIGWGAFVMPANTFLPAAGPAGTAIAMAIAACVMTLIAWNYAYMIVRYPIAGGEFAYISETFGKTHAFAASWLLGLCYLAIVPLNATALALVGRNLLGGIFQVGFHYTVAGYDVYLGELLLAVGALLVFAFLSIRGVQFAGVFQTILVFAIVAGVAVIVIGALASTGSGTAGIEPAFAPDRSTAGGIAAIVAVAPWAFVGFDTIPQAAEEYRFSPARSKLLMVVSIVFGAAIYAVLTLVTASVRPEGYASWSEYIAAAGELSGIEALPTFHAAYSLLGPVGLGLLGMAVSAAIMSGIVGFYMATSRLLFAMGRERTLPAWFGQVDSRHRTPRNAIVFVMAISLVAPFFGRTALGWLVDMSSVGAAVGYGYTSLAAWKIARQEGRRSIQITGALGAALSLGFIALLLLPVPGVGASLGFESYVCLAVWLVAGIVFRLASRRASDSSPER